MTSADVYAQIVGILLDKSKRCAQEVCNIEYASHKTEFPENPLIHIITQ